MQGAEAIMSVGRGEGKEATFTLRCLEYQFPTFQKEEKKERVSIQV
jgi:hypothetical protein